MRKNNDSLLEAAILVIHQHHSASTALLQRKLKIGYFVAADLLQKLEDLGMVSGKDGAWPRKVLNG